MGRLFWKRRRPSVGARAVESGWEGLYGKKVRGTFRQRAPPPRALSHAASPHKPTRVSRREVPLSSAERRSALISWW